MGLFKRHKAPVTSETELSQRAEIERLQAELARLNELCRSVSEENRSILEINRRISEENKMIRAEMEQMKATPRTRTYNGIVLTEEQNHVVDLLEDTNSNYFITGKAGTGKSVILNCFQSATKKKNIAVCALTGAAAINIGGSTIHSLFGLELQPQDTRSKSKVRPSPMIIDVLKAIDVLIIDEVSMVRADIMDMMDARLRFAKQRDMPFGGCQVIAFGDLYQLPPIAKEGFEKDFILDRYHTLHFFGAPAASSFKTVQLETVLRQKDEAFINILSRIRDGSIEDDGISLLNRQCCDKDIPEDSLRIVLTKEMARTINMQKLAKINSSEKVFTAEIGGPNPPSKSDAPADYELHLKVGAKVMITRNDPQKRYVNGTLGRVTKISDTEITVKTKQDTYAIEPYIWYNKTYRRNRDTGELETEIVGYFKQFPLRLAYALTVHKSQGQTYDNVVVDYADRNAFAPGQTYVALSRCRTIEGLKLTRPLTRRDIYADEEVTAYLKPSKRKRIVISNVKYERVEPEDLPF